MTRLVNLLENNEAVLIYTPVNRQYFTNFCSSLGYLFVTKSRCVLLVDSRYYLAAKESVKDCEVVLVDNISNQLLNLAKDNNINKVLVEYTVSVAELKFFEKVFNGILVEASEKITEKINEFRSVKTSAEIEKIVSAQRIAEKAFLETLNSVKTGVTERELAAELEYRMKLLGSSKESFDTIVVSGYKSAMPHGVPSDKKIENGDFITFDFGAIYDGYHSDMTRTVALGFVTDKMHEVYNTVLEANKAAENVIKAGVNCRDVDTAARCVIKNKGLDKYFTHSTGHSLGLEVHESPSLSPKSNEMLQVGQIVTDEPGIYIEGEFGVRIEDMLLVTENGCKNLTKFEKTIIIL